MENQGKRPDQSRSYMKILIWAGWAFLISMIVFICASCSDDPLRLVEYGYLKVNGEIEVPELTAKTDVPECSPFTPNKIKFRLINSIDQAFTQESSIALNGDQVIINDEMTFPIGDYEVDEVSLLTDNVITHTVPHELDSNLDLTDLVTRPLPFSVSILPDQTTNTSVELLCYTIEPIELSPNWTGDTTITELQTIYFYVPVNPNYDPETGDDRQFCIDYVTITMDAWRYIELPVYEPGLNQIPAPKEFTNGLLSGYSLEGGSATLLQGIYFGTYNPDGNLTEEDILIFNDNCN